MLKALSEAIKAIYSKIIGSFNRFQSYQQLEQADCGITCVRMIAAFYGLKLSPSYLRSRCEESKLGISISDIINLLKSIGFDAIAVRFGIDKIKEMPLPAVMYWNQNHFVVLYKISKRRFFIADPGSGKLHLSEEEFYEKWLSGNEKGIAILAEPPAGGSMTLKLDEYKKEDTAVRSLLKRFQQCIKINRQSFLAIIALSVLAILADILIPLIFQQTVDAGISSKDISLVWILVFIQFSIAIGNFATSWGLEYIITKLGLKVGLRMIDEYLSKLVSMPMSFFSKKISADLIQKIEDQNRIKDFLIAMPGSLFVSLLSIIIFSSMLAYYSPLVWYILITATIIKIVWNNLFLRKTKEIDYSKFSAMACSGNQIYEIVNGINEIKINGAQEKWVGIWRKYQKKIQDLSLKSFKIELLASGGDSLMSRLQEACVTGICATLVIYNEMTVGAMMTVGYLTGRLVTPLTQIAKLHRQIQTTSMAVERVDEVTSYRLTNNSAQDKIAMGDIELSHLYFKYPGSASPYVINDLSMIIPKGSTIAIVGSSGCGKTTLVNLILGLYSPTSGTIKVGGRLLCEPISEKWMNNCAMVMQDGKIFSGTILSNIAMADEIPDMERISSAISIACLSDFIDSLPMGINTKIGTIGISVSGGQKQRILIARAVYHNPELLILDESTSSLDAANESMIVRNIAEFKQDRTLIIVAHRLSTVKNADKIVFIDKGRITEVGSHKELLERRGGYFQLVSNQLELAQ